MAFSVVDRTEKLIRFLLPKEIRQRPEGYEKRQVKAASAKNSVRNLLLYRYYTEDNSIGPDGFNGGFYTMADGRQGVIFRISPPPYLTDGSEGIVNSLVSQVYYDDITMHIITHASKNIESYIEQYKRVHHCNVNVKHPEVLQAMVGERASALRKWRNESMSNISDFKLRTFNNIISFSFPQGMTKSTMVQQVNSYVGVLGDFYPQNLGPEELLTITKEILQPDLESWDSHHDVHRKLNAQMAEGSRIRMKREDNYFRIGKSTYARTLTTDKFPKSLRTTDYQGAFMDPFGKELTSAIPGSFLCTLSVSFSETEKRRKQALSKSRWNIGNLGGLPTKIKKKYPHTRDKYIEATDTVEYITENGEVPLEAMWSLVLFEDSGEALDNLTARVRKRFEDIKGMWKLKIIEQQPIAYQSMMMSLPLQYMDIWKKHLDRHDLLWKSNNAQLAPLLGDIRGFGLPYLLYAGRAGQVIPIDPLSQNANYNFMINGPMGSGKSVFTNDMASQLLSSGFRLIGMDIGRSYMPAVKSIGGQFVEFTNDVDLCFNFFTKAQTKFVKKYDNEQGTEVTIEQIHEDELSNIIPLIGIMMNINLSMATKTEDSSDMKSDLARKMLSTVVESAVQMAFKRKHHAAGMSTVYESLIAIRENFKNEHAGPEMLEILQQAILAIRDFSVDTGKYYSYFNGANNINFESDYFVMELEELRSTKGELLPVIQFAMLQRIATEAFLDDERPMFVFFDEARYAMKNKIFVAALVDFATRFRKYKKFLAVISQTLDDFFVNTNSKIMFDTSSYKIFLQTNPGMINSAVKEGHLSLSPFEKEQMGHIRNHAPNYNEACIRFNGHNIISTLKLTKLELYMYSTNPRDKDRRRALIERHGFSFVEIAYYMMVEDEGKFTAEEDILNEMRRRITSGGNDEKLKEMWIGRIGRAISERSFVPYLQPMYSDDGDGTMHVCNYEVLMRIKTIDGDIPAAQFIDIAKEKGIYEKAVRTIAIQTFELFSMYPDVRFTMNISMSDILDPSMREYLIDEAVNYRVNDRLTLDVASVRLGRKDTEKLAEAVAKIREANIYIAIDNVTHENMDISAMLMVKPDIIKVDGSIIRNIEEKEDARMFLEIVSNGLKAVGIKVAASHVATEKIMKVCKEYGISHMQGYYLKRPSSAKDMLNETIKEGAGYAEAV